MSFAAGRAYEAPGILKVDETYFLIVSGKTGWCPTETKCSTPHPSPAHGKEHMISLPQMRRLITRRIHFEHTIKESKQTTHIYMDDDWDSKGGAISNYVWLPMAVDSR
jgi:hypothetical protein